MSASEYLSSIFLFEPKHEGAGSRVGVVVKKTYALRRGEPVPDADVSFPVFEGDVHWGEPGKSSIRHETDLVPFKPLTDIVVNARCYAPKGVAVRETRAAVEVGKHRHEVLVVGDRYVRQERNFPPFFSEPLKFETMLVRYEYAYGGTDPKGPDGQPIPYPRNPVGMGMAFHNPDLTVDGMPLPNIEDAGRRLKPETFIQDPMKWEEAPMPVGLGWVARSWWQRKNEQGVPELLREMWDQMYNRKRDGSFVERKPFPGFATRYYNGASQGLAHTRLEGNEVVRLIRLDPEGDYEVVLPSKRPTAVIEVAGEKGAAAEHEVELTLNTVAIQKEEQLMYLVWGGFSPTIPLNPLGKPPDEYDRMSVRVGEERVR